MQTTSVQDRESDAELLDKTQAYLEYRSRGHDPPSYLAAAWDQFYDGYAPRLRAELARWHMTAVEREDCFQEVWVSVVSHLGQFRRDQGRACLSTWLTTLTRNKAVDLLRRRHRAESLIGGAEDTLLDSSPDPAADCARHEMQDLVRRVLAELSAQVSEMNYQVLYQRRIEGRTVPEIAVALGLTPEQVRLHDHRMMKRIRAFFKQSTRGGHHHP
jgi:RNA polymerase sigma-70 factor, ECF subfamily